MKTKQIAVEFLEQQIRYYISNDDRLYDMFKQAKAMEKEQMVNFAEYVATYPDKNRNYKGKILHAKSKYDGAERTIDLLEQYYNETYKGGSNE